MQGLEGIYAAYVAKQNELARQVAGDHLDLFKGQSVEEWLTEVEAIDPEAAARIRRHMARGDEETWIDRADRWSTDRVPEKQRLHRGALIDNIRSGLNEMEAPLWESIDRQVPQGKSLDGFKLRRGFPDVKKARDAVQKWLGAEGPPLITLFGVPGVGKTHLVQAAAADLDGRGKAVIYRSEVGLIGEAMGRMQTRTSEALIEAVCQMPWFILDDFGVASVKDWGESVLDRLIDARYQLAQSRQGFTLITTNLLREDTPPRIARRLSEPGVSEPVTIKASGYYERQS